MKFSSNRDQVNSKMPPMSIRDKVLFSIYLNLGIAKLSALFEKEIRTKSMADFFGQDEEMMLKKAATFFPFKVDAHSLYFLVNKLESLRGYCSHWYYDLTHGDPHIFYPNIRVFVDELFQKAKNEIIRTYPFKKLGHIEKMEIFYKTKSGMFTLNHRARYKNDKNVMFYDGLEFFTSLFLTTEEVISLLEQLRDKKQGTNKSLTATQKLFTHYSIQPTKMRTRQDDEKFRFFIRMLDDLNRMPNDLYDHATSEVREKYGGMVRSHDKFPKYALRLIDELQLLPELTFKVYTGNLRPKSVSKYSENITFGTKRETVFAKGHEYGFVYAIENNNATFNIKDGEKILTGCIGEHELQNIVFARINGRKTDLEITTAIKEYIKKYQKYATALLNNESVQEGELQKKEKRRYFTQINSEPLFLEGTQLLKHFHFLLGRYQNYQQNSGRIKKIEKVSIVIEIIKENIPLLNSTQGIAQSASRKNHKLNFDRYKRLLVTISKMDTSRKIIVRSSESITVNPIEKLKYDLQTLLSELNYPPHSPYFNIVKESSNYQDLFDKVVHFSVSDLSQKITSFDALTKTEKKELQYFYRLKNTTHNEEHKKEVISQYLKAPVALPSGFTKRYIYKLPGEKSVAGIIVRFEKGRTNTEKFVLGSFYSLQEGNFDVHSFYRTDEGVFSSTKNAKALKRFFNGRLKYCRLKDKVSLLMCEKYYQDKLATANALTISFREGFDVSKVIGQDVTFKVLGNLNVRIPCSELLQQFRILRKDRMLRILKKNINKLNKDSWVDFQAWEKVSNEDFQSSKDLLEKALELEEVTCQRLSENEKKDMLNPETNNYYQFTKLINNLTKKNIINAVEGETLKELRRMAAHYDSHDSIEFSYGVLLLESVIKKVTRIKYNHNHNNSTHMRLHQPRRSSRNRKTK